MELIAPANGIEVAYEAFGDPADPTVLLVMGLGVQMLGWDAELCELLAGRGFYVVRFDNRDVGRSTKIEGGPRPDIMAAAAGDASSRATRSTRWRRTARAARPPGGRGGARGGRLAGRDDRPDAGDPASGAGAVAGVDHVDDGGSGGRAAASGGAAGAADDDRRRTGRGLRSSWWGLEGDRVAGVRRG